jgi:hypothetical protein
VSLAKPNITPNQWTILEMLRKRPCWARSFQWVKPLLADLINKGLAERCRPPLGRARNMVKLTESGVALMAEAYADVEPSA